VFGNLLSNAAAHARTQVRVTVAREEHALMVAIEDDGDGVSDDQRSQILEPFVRLDDGRARAGTGLGLAIVRRLAEAHGHPVVLCASDLGGLRVETRWPLEGEAGED
jgi:two-component system sensor histidine kinase RstB